jgi:hypothetical protein
MFSIDLVYALWQIVFGAKIIDLLANGFGFILEPFILVITVVEVFLVSLPERVISSLHHFLLGPLLPIELIFLRACLVLAFFLSPVNLAIIANRGEGMLACVQEELAHEVALNADKFLLQLVLGLSQDSLLAVQF